MPPIAMKEILTDEQKIAFAKWLAPELWEAVEKGELIEDNGLERNVGIKYRGQTRRRGFSQGSTSKKWETDTESVSCESTLKGNTDIK